MEVSDDSVDVFRQYKLKHCLASTKKCSGTERVVKLKSDRNKIDELLGCISHGSEVVENNDEFYLQFQITSTTDTPGEAESADRSSSSYERLHTTHSFDREEVVLDDANSLSPTPHPIDANKGHRIVVHKINSVSMCKCGEQSQVDKRKLLDPDKHGVFVNSRSPEDSYARGKVRYDDQCEENESVFIFQASVRRRVA
ncbi:unnamed protein product [Didymodactylos carnosus]|uniref:Uncharacterized protein n=1 Tax=Didymodactylos carnosus TaxID=1234261 RepID=A0A815SMQ5_9BILA|nr:unnamed protein product [Didymodactylos carnosus]CAF1494742.1 unnamed protein product [Didymodactylos carnosus]CAF4185343.1 unnamed protein product [Didymodactylos carnosus]CAF4357403.1 unnamed protein product [Didymodactylos carnosus]